MKPTKSEYSRACDLGETSRRSGKGLESDPWKQDSTEKGLILSEAFQDYWCKEHEKRLRS